MLAALNNPQCLRKSKDEVNANEAGSLQEKSHVQRKYSYEGSLKMGEHILSATIVLVRNICSKTRCIHRVFVLDEESVFVLE